MGRSTRTWTLFGQLGFAALWTTIVAIWLDEWHFTPAMQIILCVGILNGLANYLMWNANLLSTSRNAFFTAFDDIIAMLLSAVIMPSTLMAFTCSKELGVAFCIVSALLLAYANYRKSKNGVEGVIPMRFYIYALGYTLCWGVAIFAIGAFALKNQASVWQFASGWYLGAAAMALVLVMLDYLGLVPRPASTDRASLPIWLRESFTIGAANSISLVLQFTAFVAVPVVVLQPVFLFTDIIVPLLVGLVIFKEAKQFKLADIVLYGTGVSGFYLILFA